MKIFIIFKPSKDQIHQSIIVTDGSVVSNDLKISNFFAISYCIGVLAKQGQHNRFSCSTNIPALKKAELVRCVAAEGMNIEKILFTNHLPIKVS